MLAAILIRGIIGIDITIKDTLEKLKLLRKHTCVLIKDTPSNRGMLKKAKDYITYGEVDEATSKELIAKKGEEYVGLLQDRKGKITYKKFFEHDGKKLKPYFRLNPPIGGFERKGIKTSFARGGALGERTNMNELIRKMI